MNNTATEVLTARDVIALSKVVTAVMANSYVKRAIDDHLYEGTVRGFTVDTEGRSPGTDRRDIRDLYVRVTLLSGTETYWPVRELAADVDRHLAAFRQQ